MDPTTREVEVDSAVCRHSNQQTSSKRPKWYLIYTNQAPETNTPESKTTIAHLRKIHHHLEKSHFNPTQKLTCRTRGAFPENNYHAAKESQPIRCDPISKVRGAREKVEEKGERASPRVRNKKK